MTVGKRQLAQPLFTPRSVALVGASDDPAKVNYRPLEYLRGAGFGGTIYPVNPRRETIGGGPCWPNLSVLPEVPDHVYVMTPTESAIATAEECARLGVPVVTVLAGGFGEDGPEGQDRQERLRAAVAGTGTRIVGPSSLGVIDLRSRMLLTANAAFAETGLAPGRTLVASQSGSIIGALVSRGKERGISFAALVSTGGEADLSLGEICAATLDDHGIGSYALFMESMHHSKALADFAVAAAERGKPVVVYKLGRSKQAAQLAVSHTGALAGADEEADALFRACGIARVDNLEALIEAPALLERIPAGTSQTGLRVAILTTTGGGAAVVVDQLGVRGIDVRSPSEALLGRIQAHGAPVKQGIILDLTLAGAKHEIVSRTIGELQRSGEFDLIVMVIGSSARFHPELAVSAVVECADGPTPLAAFAVPEAPQALAALTAAGVPAFRTPESMAEAIAAAARRPATPRYRRRSVTAPPLSRRRVLNELDSYHVLDKAGITTNPGVAISAADAIAGDIPAAIRYPVAVKVLSDTIAHKSDIGGVVLGVDSAQALQAAARSIADTVGRSAERLLVVPMASDGTDALIGYRISDEVGPVVMVAAGGVATELYRDFSLRLAPVDHATAHQMIREVKALAPVVGFRGSVGDADALAAAIVALSNLASTAPSVIEAEINPLRVYGPGLGATALDALVCIAAES